MSSLPFSDLPRVSHMPKMELAHPDNYVQLVTRRLIARGETAGISAPAVSDA